VFIDSLFYITGGNGNADPNFLYVVDRTGRLMDQFEQPRESGGLGMFDLAWDGEFLYGSADSSIFKLDLEGNVADRFTGPYDPNNALAFDNEGNLWVGSSNQPLVKIDTEGNELDTLFNMYNCRALAWYDGAADGFKLLMLIREDDQNSARLMGINPENGEMRFEADLAYDEEITPGNGLSVSDSFLPGGQTLVGMINLSGEKHIQTWFLESYAGWLEFEPDTGTVEPDEEFTIYLSFTASEFIDRQRVEADLIIESNSLEPVIEIPIVLEVGEINEIEDEGSVALPVGFEVGKAYPNPFNTQTSIKVSIPSTGEFNAAIYDLGGRYIQTVYSGNLRAGQHSFIISAENMTSGLYFVQIEYANQKSVQKIVLLR